MSLGCVELEPRADAQRVPGDGVLELSEFGLKIQPQAWGLKHFKH